MLAQCSLVGTTQLLADLLHLVVLVVDLRFLGEVLVLQVLELGHGLIDDLHVPVFLLEETQTGGRDQITCYLNMAHFIPEGTTMCLGDRLK